MHPRITKVEVLENYHLRLGFKDGTSGTVDLGHLIRRGRGVFIPFKDPEFFARVSVDHEAGTVVWPNGVDLDPDVLYEAAHRS